MAETPAELGPFLIRIVRPHAAIGSHALDTCCMRPLTFSPLMKLLASRFRFQHSTHSASLLRLLVTHRELSHTSSNRTFHHSKNQDRRP
jgi:hypothetical protein